MFGNTRFTRLNRDFTPKETAIIGCDYTKGDVYGWRESIAHTHFSWHASHWQGREQNKNAKLCRLSANIVRNEQAGFQSDQISKTRIELAQSHAHLHRNPLFTIQNNSESLRENGKQRRWLFQFSTSVFFSPVDQ
jgi:hypothetical protein